MSEIYKSEYIHITLKKNVLYHKILNKLPNIEEFTKIATILQKFYDICAERNKRFYQIYNFNDISITSIPEFSKCTDFIKKFFINNRVIFQNHLYCTGVIINNFLIRNSIKLVLNVYTPSKPFTFVKNETEVVEAEIEKKRRQEKLFEAKVQYEKLKSKVRNVGNRLIICIDLQRRWSKSYQDLKALKFCKEKLEAYLLRHPEESKSKEFVPKYDAHKQAIVDQLESLISDMVVSIDKRSLLDYNSCVDIIESLKSESLDIEKLIESEMSGMKYFIEGKLLRYQVASIANATIILS